MAEDAIRTAKWDILDEKRVDDLVASNGAAGAIGALLSESPSPEDRAAGLITLVVAGKIQALKNDATRLRVWAEANGLRRINNALVELDRVLDMHQRGQAILQSQALTRLVHRHCADDIALLKRALSER